MGRPRRLGTARDEVKTQETKKLGDQQRATWWMPSKYSIDFLISWLVFVALYRALCFRIDIRFVVPVGALVPSHHVHVVVAVVSRVLLLTVRSVINKASPLCLLLLFSRRR